MERKHDWRVRLEHARVCRDALVECGNKQPTSPDPDGGLITVECRFFNGRVFFGFLKERNHTDGDFDACKCSR